MSSESRELPLFPLHAVLYPGGRLALKIFEQRYMDMAKVCLKDDSPFGVCLILHGSEAGQPAIPEEVGTVARIVEWDMPQLGVLHVVVEGGERFRVLDYHAERSGLLRAQISPLEAEAAASVPPEYQRLIQALRSIFVEMGDQAPSPPHHFDDAAWLSFRFCELLPFYRNDKQRMLEIDNSLERLAAIERFLKSKGVLSDE